MMTFWFAGLGGRSPGLTMGGKYKLYVLTPIPGHHIELRLGWWPGRETINKEVIISLLTDLDNDNNLIVP